MINKGLNVIKRVWSLRLLAMRWPVSCPDGLDENNPNNWEFVKIAAVNGGYFVSLL